MTCGAFSADSDAFNPHLTPFGRRTTQEEVVEEEVDISSDSDGDDHEHEGARSSGEAAGSRKREGLVVIEEEGTRRDHARGGRGGSARRLMQRLSDTLLVLRAPCCRRCGTAACVFCSPEFNPLSFAPLSPTYDKRQAAAAR